jgi:formate-dependent nitrite reductase membrane component NrfD
MTPLQNGLIVLGLPLAALTAVYTGYLLAQAKARDLWQNPLLPPHFLIEALLAGSAALLPFAVWLEPDAVRPLLLALGGSSLVHLLLVIGEVTLTHPTAHARVAASEMLRGRYRLFFWPGLGLAAIGGLAILGWLTPWTGLIAAPAALVGLLLYEHAYVQAGQSAPLA